MRPATPIEILPPLSRGADELQQLEWLADLMDSRFQIPGTKFRVGLDAVLGLVPGIGDAIGAAVSLYILQRLWQHDLPWHLKARLVGNVVGDFTLGAVPLLGDLFDAGFKANHKNVSLVKQHLGREPAPLRKSGARP